MALPKTEQKSNGINGFQADPALKFIKDYYGRELETKADLKEKACCALDTESRFKDIFKLIPKEVTDKHYGCGVPIPDDDLKGLTVLDLGSGSGVDVFILAHKVGPTGFVHGVDMTPEQINIAKKNIPVVMKNFGYKKPNVEFHKDFIESAKSIADNSIDIVISDCVINLSPRKDLVLNTIYRVLKPGGEYYISDILSDRRVPEQFKNDPVSVAECLGGAEYINDWKDMAEAAGFRDPRVIKKSLVQDELKGVPISFYSITERAFKFKKPLDRRCEDYGQTATYKGNVPGHPAKFALDDHHIFEAARPMAVCQNTARMLSETRLSKYFNVTKPLQHFGIFPCGPAINNDNDSKAGACGPESCC